MLCTETEDVALKSLTPGSGLGYEACDACVVESVDES